MMGCFVGSITQDESKTVNLSNRQEGYLLVLCCMQRLDNGIYGGASTKNTCEQQGDQIRKTSKVSSYGE